ncbi:MAG: hypothetical protein US38_C0015G0012 [Candidatus Roizmanbacteria bacterium GW2011_GWC1_37_12]|nr:MAG: hypothetical protein US38_C0015G0012 [Candidatus Roizmanbacteria bacterium GW2011_GWC1_37_12]
MKIVNGKLFPPFLNPPPQDIGKLNICQEEKSYSLFNRYKAIENNSPPPQTPLNKMAEISGEIVESVCSPTVSVFVFPGVGDLYPVKLPGRVGVTVAVEAIVAVGVSIVKGLAVVTKVEGDDVGVRA